MGPQLHEEVEGGRGQFLSDVETLNAERRISLS
jgi:hypothetical protein